MSENAHAPNKVQHFGEKKCKAQNSLNTTRGIKAFQFTFEFCVQFSVLFRSRLGCFLALIKRTRMSDIAGKYLFRSLVYRSVEATLSLPYETAHYTLDTGDQ